MKFYISTESDSGSKYFNKDDFLKELSMMIDDCADNGGTEFSVMVDADACCYYCVDLEGEDEVMD